MKNALTYKTTVVKFNEGMYNVLYLLKISFYVGDKYLFDYYGRTSPVLVLYCTVLIQYL